MFPSTFKQQQLHWNDTWWSYPRIGSPCLSTDWATFTAKRARKADVVLKEHWYWQCTGIDNVRIVTWHQSSYSEFLESSLDLPKSPALLRGDKTPKPSPLLKLPLDCEAGNASSLHWLPSECLSCKETDPKVVIFVGKSESQFPCITPNTDYHLQLPYYHSNCSLTQFWAFISLGSRQPWRNLSSFLSFFPRSASRCFVSFVTCVAEQRTKRGGGAHSAIKHFLKW